MEATDEWLFLLYGYVFTVLIEAAVLLPGLSARHPLRRRLFAALWLNACSYPVVVLVLPHLLDPTTDRARYLLVAETFAPISECALFWLAFGAREEWLRPSMGRDMAAIVAANLASFGAGVLLQYFQIWPFWNA
jgi:hypothetical protein